MKQKLIISVFLFFAIHTFGQVDVKKLYDAAMPDPTLRDYSLITTAGSGISDSDRKKYHMENIPTANLSENYVSNLASIQPMSEKLIRSSSLYRIFIVGAVFIIPLALSIMFVKKRKIEDLADFDEKISFE